MKNAEHLNFNSVTYVQMFDMNETIIRFYSKTKINLQQITIKN